jgi:hypothetical protein
MNTITANELKHIFTLWQQTEWKVRKLGSAGQKRAGTLSINIKIIFLFPKG